MPVENFLSDVPVKRSIMHWFLNVVPDRTAIVDGRFMATVVYGEGVLVLNRILRWIETTAKFWVLK
tara:strand:+ start:548 stop:745 length:198 start_codon:yes stop_codon:yes gene_type:complete